MCDGIAAIIISSLRYRHNAIAVDVTAVFGQMKLIFKHYDLNVRISILPEIKFSEKKGRKRHTELLCKQLNRHVLFRDFSLGSVLFCVLDSRKAFAHIHHYHYQHQHHRFHISIVGVCVCAMRIPVI